MKGKSIWLVGYQPGYDSEIVLFELKGPDEVIGAMISSTTLRRLGYTVQRFGRNLVSVSKDGQEYFIRSRGVQGEKNSVF